MPTGKDHSGAAARQRNGAGGGSRWRWQRRGSFADGAGAAGSITVAMRAINYLNTDLDLVSDDDITELVGALVGGGIHPLHAAQAGDGRWYATFETDVQHGEAQASLEALLRAVEALGDRARAIWHRCRTREFNVGYECGTEPWAFNQAISDDVVRRIGAVSAGLRITLYPATQPRSEAPSSHPDRT